MSDMSVRSGTMIVSTDSHVYGQVHYGNYYNTFSVPTSSVIPQPNYNNNNDDIHALYAEATQSNRKRSATQEPKSTSAPTLAPQATENQNIERRSNPIELTYDFRDGWDWGRISDNFIGKMPENTVHVENSEDIINDIDNRMNGTCDCISKITFSDHSGEQGQVTLGDNIAVNPTYVNCTNRLKGLIEQDPKYWAVVPNIMQKQWEAEKKFFNEINKYLCEDFAVVEFNQCNGYAPETQKYLERYFEGNTNILLYKNSSYYGFDQEVHEYSDFSEGLHNFWQNLWD